MLTKITDKLYIDLDEVLYIFKRGKDIHIIFKERDAISESVYTKEGKALIRVLNEEYGEEVF